jgi:hypothetical protein
VPMNLPAFFAEPSAANTRTSRATRGERSVKASATRSDPNSKIDPSWLRIIIVTRDFLWKRGLNRLFE